MGSAELLLVGGLMLIGIAIYLVVQTVLGGGNHVQALAWADDAKPDKSKSGFIEFSRPLVHRLCLGLVAKIKSPGYRKRVEKKILTSGLERVLNVDEFIGIQVLWGVFMPAVFMALNVSLEAGYSPMVIVGMGAIGAYLPHLHTGSARKKRYLSVIIDLPFFIDILALSTEAGLDFIGSIQRVVDKAQNSVLAEELGKVLRDIKLGQSRADSLKAMAARLDIPEITSFIAVLVDADATGASISGVLKQQSGQMRTERFTRAEKAGARASQAILLPLILFILPAVMIMVMGPIVIQFLGN